MGRGKNINLFLIDGDAGGRLKCTIANWTGIAYKIPRTELEKSKDRMDLKQSGVYFLFGVSDETGNNVVYIGQAGARKNGEGILTRIFEHKRNPEKDYWTDAVIFTTQNNSFGPTEISYLENQFCNLALSTKRFEVKNSVDPTLGNITEEKESEMEEFIDYSKLIMGTLGYRLFVPLVETKVDNSVVDINEEQLLFMKRKSKKSNILIDAKCRQTNEGFVVLAGSLIETIDSESIPDKIKMIRKDANVDENGILQEDILFNSPSYAAAFVYGGNINGLVYWKNDKNVSLKEIENSNSV